MTTFLKRIVLATAGVAVCMASIAHSAPIGVGDVIAVDISSAGGHAAGFNLIGSNTTLPAGNVIRYGDGTVVDGVSLSFTGAQGFNNDSPAHNWPGAAADPYYSDSRAWDLAWASSPLTLTFTGLDTSLRYNVRVYSLIGNNPARTETFEVTGAPSTTLGRGDRWNAAPLEAGGTVFESAATDAWGSIVVSAAGAAQDNVFLNAVVLEAAPPPPLTEPLTAHFGASRDNFMYAGTHGPGYRDRNWGTLEHILAGPNTSAGADGAPYRGLVGFDVSSLAAVPNVEVQSATLTLTVSSLAKMTENLRGEYVQLFLLDDANADWWEGSGNDSVVSGASSWNYLAYNSVDWAGGPGIGTNTGSPGLAALLAEVEVPQNVAVGDTMVFTIDSTEGLQALQSWATGGTNAGFFLETSTDTGDTHGAGALGAIYFASKEHGTAGFRPVLSVTYIPEPGTGLMLLLAGLAALGFRRDRRR